MTNRTADQEPGGLSPTPPALAQVNRPTEAAADLTDRPLPTLGRALEMLEIAERNGDRYGARLFRCMVERISDTTCIAGLTEQGSPSKSAVELLRTAVGLLRTARWAGDQGGVQMFSELIDRILDAAYAAPTELRPGADGADEITEADGVAEVTAHLMPANQWDREGLPLSLGLLPRLTRSPPPATPAPCPRPRPPPRPVSPTATSRRATRPPRTRCPAGCWSGPPYERRPARGALHRPGGERRMAVQPVQQVVRRLAVADLPRL